jgi:NAD(P) transhydrogenase subunit alpha
MELIPRTSRAQSMDVLSSQAGIGGYRAVLEAASRYGRFFPMMMTSAGSAKACKFAVLGVGVAGLQAIATARKLGAMVEAYDVRKEVREQILSLGAKVIDLDVGEEGSGTGGYAKELSEEAKRKQQAALTERLKGFDVIVSTANIPGRKSPVLITEDAVKGMRPGSVIVDMAAANGGNCPLTEADKIVIKHGVVLVGITNYPALVPSDASHFYAQNLVNLLDILWTKKEGSASQELNLTDDIVAASLVTHKGALCHRG